jgi:outer membrane lipoprotein-sorting protein
MKTKMSFQKNPAWLLLLFLYPNQTFAGLPTIEGLLNNMKSAYHEVHDYQTKVEVRTYDNDHSFTTEKFLYTFKKPNQIRIDFETPYPGMVLVYPDRQGKVGVRPSGWASFLKLSLAPDSFLLTASSGQTIDRTDMGLLIENIAKSLTEERHDQPEIEEEGEDIRIRVLTDNHFRKGVRTHYEFLIDKTRWLPVQVSEFTPDGVLERRVIFNDLKVNIGAKDSLFQMD